MTGTGVHNQRDPQAAMHSHLARQLAADAVIKEFEFVSSLISMYRNFELRAIGFGMVIYAATVGLVGTAIGTPEPDRFGLVARFAAALLPWPITLLVGAFMVMEIRIVRASRYISGTLTATLDEVLGLTQLLGRADLLRWERDPGYHLTTFQKRMSSSATFIAVLGAPALASAIWYQISPGGTPVGLRLLSAAGLASLVLSMILTARISSRHERRNRKNGSEEAPPIVKVPGSQAGPPPPAAT